MEPSVIGTQKASWSVEDGDIKSFPEVTLTLHCDEFEGTKLYYTMLDGKQLNSVMYRKGLWPEYSVVLNWLQTKWNLSTTVAGVLLKKWHNDACDREQNDRKRPICEVDIDSVWSRLLLKGHKQNNNLKWPKLVRVDLWPDLTLDSLIESIELSIWIEYAKGDDGSYPTAIVKEPVNIQFISIYDSTTLLLRVSK